MILSDSSNQNTSNTDYYHFRSTRDIKSFSQDDYSNIHDDALYEQQSMTTFSYQWFGLYNLLTYEEANALFRYLKPMHYADIHTIVWFGEPNTSLYFLNMGTVYVTLRLNNRIEEKFKLGPGNLFGGDSFFSGKNSEVSVVSWDDVSMDCLQKSDLDLLVDHFPNLESKLHKFWMELSRSYRHPDQRIKERRNCQRVSAKGSVRGSLIDGAGAFLGVNMSGELVNISKGGFSFRINPDYHFDIVGNYIDATIKVDINKKVANIHWKGSIVGVNRDDGHLLVHVKGIGSSKGIN